MRALFPGTMSGCDSLTIAAMTSNFMGSLSDGVDSSSSSSLRRNRDHKQILEMDWSDKKEAEEIDAFCANLRNEHTCKQFYPGAARFQEMLVLLIVPGNFRHLNILRNDSGFNWVR